MKGNISFCCSSMQLSIKNGETVLDVQTGTPQTINLRFGPSKTRFDHCPFCGAKHDVTYEVLSPGSDRAGHTRPV